MTFFRRRKRLAMVAALAAVSAAGIAYAYFDASGSGTGSAAVGTSSALTIHPTVASTLYPGVSSSVTFTVDNPSSGHQLLGTIHLASVRACVGSGSSWNGTGCSNGGTEASTCESVETGASDTNTANFWMPDTVENQDLGTGSGQTVTNNGSLKMNDLSTSQDACKSANLTLSFTS